MYKNSVWKLSHISWEYGSHEYVWWKTENTAITITKQHFENKMKSSKWKHSAKLTPFIHVSVSFFTIKRFSYLLLSIDERNE